MIRGIEVLGLPVDTLVRCVQSNDWECYSPGELFIVSDYKGRPTLSRVPITPENKENTYSGTLGSWEIEKLVNNSIEDLL